MKQNMGITDRVIRSFAAMTMGVLMNIDLFSVTGSIVLSMLVALLLCTSFAGVCPFYALFHFSTIHYPMTPKTR
ncbi:MAG: DUF2892 domain-containing protein [Ignavibacteriales bacterium]|nr:DUF2892 domain-containing protein [Ignavibacteriales bacterium]